MRLIVIIIMSCLFFTDVAAQKKYTQEERDSLLNRIEFHLDNIEFSMEVSKRYKIYPTEATYIFLQLDTRSGMIDLVQWSLDADKEFKTSLNSEDLALMTRDNGQFELIPTKNMYQFLLLDKKLGRVWHVQWGFKENERWIRRIR